MPFAIRDGPIRRAALRKDASVESTDYDEFAPILVIFRTFGG
jgi:hypothetical protein